MRILQRDLPAVTSFGYFVLAFSWIAGSDGLIKVLRLEPGLGQWLQTVKGWGFVTVTTFLLFRVLKFWQAQRDLAQLALAESESRLRQMADSVQEVFWLTDPDKQTILFVSSAYERIWGRSCKLLYEQPQTWIDAIVPEDRQTVLRSLPLQTSGEYDLTYRIKTPEGVEKWIHDRAFPVPDELGRVYRVAGVARDVTRQHQSEAKRQELEQQLRHSQKMEALGLLAGSVAHDFNNLLTIVLGGASLIQPSRPEDADSLREISHAAERAAGLTRQLLTFSRKQIRKVEVLDVNEVLQNVTGILRRLVGEQISVRTSFAPQLPKIVADAGMLEQVLVNLVVNSRDAMSGGGKLDISTFDTLRAETCSGQVINAPPGRYVCLEIRDSGKGIEPEILPHIFDPFFTTKDVGKGTGLGLPTVYGILEQHQGGLEIESRPGVGTSIRALFPASGLALKSSSRKAAATLTQGRGRVLLAEDDPALQGLVRRVLQQSGYEVVTAGTGPEALQIWLSERASIDYLVTDLVMPGGMSGWELGQRLLQQEPDLKVLYTSGYSPELAECRRALTPADHFLAKPYTPAQLTQALQNCGPKRVKEAGKRTM